MLIIIAPQYFESAAYWFCLYSRTVKHFNRAVTLKSDDILIDCSQLIIEETQGKVELRHIVSDHVWDSSHLMKKRFA